jgi:putative transposase
MARITGGSTLSWASVRTRPGHVTAGCRACPSHSNRWTSCCSPFPKTRVVHRDGIRFQGLRFVSPTLAAYVGEPVVVRYDPRDITEIRVFHRNSFVCKAVDPAHQGATITLKDIQAARNARRRAIRTQVNERIAVVTQFLPAHAPKRAAAPPPTVTVKRPKPKLRTYQEDA